MQEPWSIKFSPPRAAIVGVMSDFSLPDKVV